MGRDKRKRRQTRRRRKRAPTTRVPPVKKSPAKSSSAPEPDLPSADQTDPPASTEPAISAAGAIEKRETREPEAVDREPETVDREPEAVDREPEVVDREPEAVDREPEVEEPAVVEPLPGGFLKGAVLGLVFAIPAIAATLFALARLEILGDARATYEHIVTIAAIFAGVPAFITAGGIGRGAAYAAGARRRPPLTAALISAVVNGAAAGTGLILLTALPLGHLPEEPLSWIWLALAGVPAGAVTGAVIALWVAYGDPQKDDT